MIILFLTSQDEKLEDSWSLMTESDLIAVFDQFPFTGLLIYLLDIERKEGMVYKHDKKKVLVLVFIKKVFWRALC